MTVSVEVSGQPITEWKNLRASDGIADRQVASFELLTDPGVEIFDGEPVAILDGNDRIFGGIIRRPRKQPVTPAGDLRYTLRAIDWHYLADRRIIARVYEDTPAGQIVRELVDEILADDDVTYIDPQDHFDVSDPDGDVWRVTVDDGALVTTNIGSGAVGSVVLRDRQLRLWEVTADTDGTLLLTEVDDGERESFWLDDSGDTWQVAVDRETLTLRQTGGASVHDGPTITDARFNWVPASQALDGLAERAGFWWNIDPDKVLWFAPYDAHQAPFDVEPDAAGVIPHVIGPSFDDEERPGELRTRQFVRGATDETDELDERFVGDGERRTFTVGYPIAKRPEITVNGVAQTVGVRGFDDDAGADWFFSFQSNELTQERSATPLTSSDALEVTYTGLFPVVIVSRDDDAIAERQEREGFGTGKIDRVLEDDTIKTRQDAFDRAGIKLDRFSRTGRQLRFSTQVAGFKAGQSLKVTVPALALDTTMLITRVEAQLDTTQLRYTVTAIEGAIEESWIQFFNRLDRKPESLVVFENAAEDEIITILHQFSKTWTEAERPNIFLRPVADSTYQADGTIQASFRPADRLGYVEAYDDAGEFMVRKQIVQSEGLDSDEITTITLLTATDAAGEVGEIAWFGGLRATATEGTGVEVARETVNEAKTTAEAWQLDRVDTKWSS